MTIHIGAITFDCANALQLAEFWAQALNRTIADGQPPASEHFASLPPSGKSDSAPLLMFIQVPEEKRAKNRVHLDLGSSDMAADTERLLALGATHVHDKDEWGIQWTTFADPEGNEFCIADASAH